MRWVDQNGPPAATQGRTQSRLGGMLMRCAGAYLNSVLLPRIKEIFSGNFQDEHFISGELPGCTPLRKLNDVINIKKF